MLSLRKSCTPHELFEFAEPGATLLLPPPATAACCRRCLPQPLPAAAAACCHRLCGGVEQPAKHSTCSRELPPGCSVNTASSWSIKRAAVLGAMLCVLSDASAAALLWALPQTRLMTRLCRLWLSPSPALLPPARLALVPRNPPSAAASRSGRLSVRRGSNWEQDLARMAPAGQRQPLPSGRPCWLPGRCSFLSNTSVCCHNALRHLCRPRWHAAHRAHQGCRPPPPPAAARCPYKRPRSAECRCNQA
jgi:hypothetical protein